MAEIDSKQAEQTLIDDVIAEGKLEDETHRMDVSIKPNCDIEGNYPEQTVAEAIEGAEDERVTENITVGTDENGHQYAEVTEDVTGEE